MKVKNRNDLLRNSPSETGGNLKVVATAALFQEAFIEPNHEGGTKPQGWYKVVLLYLNNRVMSIAA